jgi:MoxR-like ATPase
MKAETGAVGRALGFAGMLVIPGSGVATAEDMLELSTHNATAAAEAAVPPAVSAADAVVDQAPSDEQMRERIQTLVEQLRSSDEPALERFQEWARGRKITLATAQGAALRGAIRKLEGLLEADGA